MILLLLQIYVAFAKDKFEESPFLNKNIRIFFSKSNHIYLGYNDSENNIFTGSKYGNIQDFQTNSKITLGTKEGTYKIKIGPKYLCHIGQTIRACGTIDDSDDNDDIENVFNSDDNSYNWKIENDIPGYIIKNDGLCLTAKADTRFELQECGKLDEQLYDFRLIDDIEECIDDGCNSKGNKDQILFVNVNQRENIPNCKEPECIDIQEISDKNTFVHINKQDSDKIKKVVSKKVLPILKVNKTKSAKQILLSNNAKNHNIESPIKIIGIHKPAIFDNSHKTHFEKEIYNDKNRYHHVHSNTDYNNHFHNKPSGFKEYTPI